MRGNFQGLVIGGVDWHSGKVSESRGCELDSHWDHCFNSLKALGKLLTTNVQFISLGVNRCLAKDSVYQFVPGVIVVGATGVCY